MRDNEPLRQLLLDHLEAMSPRLRQAAQHLIDHPQDIALLSMRRLAQDAGVPPATMTRLAQFVGEDGFEALRNAQIAAMRSSETGLVAHATPIDGPENGANTLITKQLASVADLAAHLANGTTISAIKNAAVLLSKARRLHVLGGRSCHSIAWQFRYVMGLLGRDVVLLDGPAGTGADALLQADKDDALLVISVSPYTSHSRQIAQYAARAGLTVIALTDSPASPLIRHARHSIICPVGRAGFFHSLVPLMAVADMLSTLIAADAPEEALAALSRADTQFAALSIYDSPKPLRAHSPAAVAPMKNSP